MQKWSSEIYTTLKQKPGNHDGGCDPLSCTLEKCWSGWQSNIYSTPSVVSLKRVPCDADCIILMGCIEYDGWAPTACIDSTKAIKKNFLYFFCVNNHYVSPSVLQGGSSSDKGM